MSVEITPTLSKCISHISFVLLFGIVSTITGSYDRGILPQKLSNILEENRKLQYLGVASEGKHYLMDNSTERVWHEALFDATELFLEFGAVATRSDFDFVQNIPTELLPGGFYWTAGRDAMAPSQYAWHTGEGTLQLFDTQLATIGMYQCLTLHVHSSTSKDYHAAECMTGKYFSLLQYPRNE